MSTDTELSLLRTLRDRVREFLAATTVEEAAVREGTMAEALAVYDVVAGLSS